MEYFLPVSSVAQLCPNLYDPMDFSIPGFPVHHQFPELAQTQVHWVGDATQPPHISKQRMSQSSVIVAPREGELMSPIKLRKERTPAVQQSAGGQHRNQSDYILCSQRWRRLIKPAKTKPGADWASNHELLIAKFRLQLKKVGKTIRPFRYDLNQIRYDYTVEVRNRFKGLDLIECLTNYGCRFGTLYRTQGSRPSPRKRNAKRQNGCLRRPYK